MQVLASWTASTACIVLYAVSKMRPDGIKPAATGPQPNNDPEVGLWQRGVSLPKKKAEDGPNGPT